MDCNRFFSERRFTGYSGLKLPPEKINQIVNCLVEGVSIRATSRLVGVEKKTVLCALVHAGEICQRVMDTQLRGLNLRHIQADGLWSYVGRHDREAWIFLATDGETKLLPSFAVGPRDITTAERLMVDLAERLANRPQITTDGLRAYLWAVERAFGSEVDYGMLIKSYATSEDGTTELWGRYHVRSLASPIRALFRPATRSGTM